MQPTAEHPSQMPMSRLERWALAVWQRPAWLAPLALALCAAAASTYVLTNNPTDDRVDALGPCAFKAVTGWDCPGCGGTRMVWYLLHGNLGQAAAHHVMALLAVPFLAYAYIAFVAKRLRGATVKWLPLLRIPGWLWAVYAVAWAAFAVLRNLPIAPFDSLYV